MPELPEVQTTVNGLNAEVKGLTIADVWTDYKSHFHKGKENIKDPRYFELFKKSVAGSRITRAERQGKNVLIHLSNHKTILVHMKMTGHFMFGSYFFDKKAKTWKPVAKTGPLLDPYNKFIRFVILFKNEPPPTPSLIKEGETAAGRQGGSHPDKSNDLSKQLVFSDLRKFAKIFMFDTENIKKIEDLMHLGPDALKETTLPQFRKLLKNKSGKIKQVLMDQHVLSGIGNIYSDEMLWKAGIHPLSVPSQIPDTILKKLYASMCDVLKKGIDFGGDSDSDYRNIYGEPGKFQHTHNAYRKTGKPCPKKNCSGVIKRIKVGGRSAHFCDTHQKLYK
jgi:formamidopyrimidine-DNA glycosylase